MTMMMQKDQQTQAEAAELLVPLGYKQTEVGVIPDDWEVRTLGQVSEVRMCKRILAGQTGKTGDIPFFKIGTFGGQPDAYIPLAIYNEFKAKYSFPKEGDILISAAGTLGKTVVYDGKPAYFQDSNIVWLDVDKERILNEYLYHYYKVIEWASSEGSTIARLYNGIIRASLISLPPIQEQTAIANALSDVDALLGSLEVLIAKKQAIKTATMQQLLTGRTRLPQFALHEDGTTKGYKTSELGEIPEDWEVSSLRTLLIEPPKYGINAPAVQLKGALPVYIRITDISEDGYFKPSEKVAVNSQLSHLYQLNDGDIVLARTGASVGKSYLYNKEDGTLVYAGFLIKISLNKERGLPNFLFQYFKTEKYWSWVVVNSMRSGQPGINGNEYSNLPVPTPSIEEQTAIATILSDMDEDIQALERRLAKTRDLKQGMMQQLLTGKVRLPVASAS